MDAPVPLLDALTARLGPKAVITDPAALAPHLQDWRGRPPGRTPAMVAPASTAEVADVVRLCAAHGAAITPQGGNTGLVEGQIPRGEILLSLARLIRIRAVDPIDDSLTAEAGVVLTSVQAAAAAAGRLFPLSLGSEGSATIGGLISTNAGGVHVVRYGMMRDLVLGLEVVLANGDILDGLTSLRKNNTGYDLKQLFIGAEGTLGIITAASLKLFPRPLDHVVALAALPDADAGIALLHQVKAETGALAAFEMMNRTSVALAVRHGVDVREPLALATPWLALMEFDCAADAGLEGMVEQVLGAAMEAGLAVDAAIAKNHAEAKRFWRVRETIPAAHRGEGAQINHDVSVPVSQVPRFLEAAEAAAQALCAGARVVAFGHAGDGNIHYTVMQPLGADPKAFPAGAIQDAVHALAVSLGGSISAEHGIGVSRREELPRYKDPAAMALMRRMKAALDPDRLLNPRALLG